MPREILVPVDGSKAAMVALDEAFTIARATGANLHVLTVILRDYSLPAAGATTLDRETLIEALRVEPNELASPAAHRARHAGVKVSVEALGEEKRPIHEAILDYAKEQHVDLIAMGTHGRTGLDRFLFGKRGRARDQDQRHPCVAGTRCGDTPVAAACNASSRPPSAPHVCPRAVLPRQR